MFEDAVKKLTEKFGKPIDISTEEGEAFQFKTDELYIGIFSLTYPNYGYCNTILAEHKENFDKWSKAYYSCYIPNNELEFKILFSDLKHISTNLQQQAGNKFSGLSRTFL